MTEDATRGIQLELRPNQKTAKVTEDGPPTESELRRGIPSSLTMLEDWLATGQVKSDLGTGQIDGRDAVGLRMISGERTADLWVDRQTRQIIRFLEPSADVYDPDTDPVARNPVPADEKISGQEIKGWMWTDIVYDPPLDDAQFVLTPPPDYELTVTRFRKPEEKDLLQWLKIFAEVRGGTFPDNENSPLSHPDVSARIVSKPADQRSPSEEALLRGFVTGEEIPLKGGGGSVVVLFRLMYEKTWHYQGKGVALGDAATPICWYRPDGTENYRVIYGDLSVRVTAIDDLPSKR